MSDLASKYYSSGPKAPKTTINSYLTPLVVELKEAWSNGFDVFSVEGIPVNVKLALSCVTCDICTC